MSKRLDELDALREDVGFGHEHYCDPDIEGCTCGFNQTQEIYDAFPDMMAVIRAVGVECEGHHQATSDDEDSCDCLLCEAYRKFEEEL